MSILDEAGAGITIEPEDAGALAEAVRRLQANEPACRTYGRNARTYIIERCSREQTAKQYVEVMEDVVGRAR